MPAFQQTSSIARKLKTAIALVVGLLVIQFAVPYLTAQKFLAGLSDLHQQEAISNLVAEIHQITDSLTQVLQSDETPKQDAERLFNGLADQATRTLGELRQKTGSNQEYSSFVSQIGSSLDRMTFSGRHYFSIPTSRASERDLALSKQFGLDVTEGEEQLELLIRRRSNELFDSLYRNRYQPFAVAVVTMSLFVILALITGMLFTRRLTAAIRGLLEATKQVSRGNLEALAPVLAGDELGMLTAEFNSMVSDLRRLTFSREYVETIIESLPDSLFVLSPAGLIQRANRTATKMSGWSAEELLEKPFKMLLANHSQSPSANVRDLEVSMATRAGQLIPMALSSSPIYSISGHVSGVVCVLKDLSDRKQLESERRRVQESQQILNDASAVLAESIDFETTLRHVLLMVVPRLGDCCFLRVRDREGGSGAFKFFCPRPEVEKEILASSEEAARTRRSVLVESARFPHAPGPVRDLEVSSYIVSPLLYRGEVLGTMAVLSTHRDRRYSVTDQALIDELVRRAAMAIENARLYHDAQEAVLSRDEFLSIASHELKTPLTSLSLQLQIFAREMNRNFAPDGSPRPGREDEAKGFPLRALKIVTASEAQSRKLAALLEELLDLTRIRLGKLQLAREEVDLSAVVRDVVERFRIEGSQKGISILIDVPESLMGLWDPMRVEQIVSNLVSNALKYGNSKPIRVSLQKIEDRQLARFTVSDQGMGIPLQMRDRIFERFERAGVSSRKISGLGLGLYICRQIVEAHGGTIHVDSVVGQGSVFTVNLPLHFEAASKSHEKAG